MQSRIVERTPRSFQYSTASEMGTWDDTYRDHISCVFWSPSRLVASPFNGQLLMDSLPRFLFKYEYLYCQLVNMSAVQQFSETNKPPDITRKITACVACRKQKIKCHMRDSQPPCSRCKKRGLPCTVNRSLQTILESDGAWKLAVDRKIVRLESALSRVATELHLPGLLDIAEALEADHEDDVHVSTSP